jgi:hypothetical protein
MTWFGMEFFGLNFGGESRTVLQDLPKKSAIDWPAQQNATPTAEPHTAHGGPHRSWHEHGSRRIRIDGSLRRAPCTSTTWRFK